MHHCTLLRRHRALQTAHTLSLSAFSLSFPFTVSHPLTPPHTVLPHHTLSSWSVSVLKPHYVLLLDLQTQLDRELQSEFVPVLCFCVSVDAHAYVPVGVCADTCMCDQW